MEELEGLGFEIASDERAMELAIHDVSLDFVHGLDRESYRSFSINKLVELRVHDVTPEYIHELAALGNLFSKELKNSSPPSQKLRRGLAVAADETP